MSNSKRLNASSSSSGVDYVCLCEDIVQRMKEVVNRGRILNERLCRFLARRLSIKIAGIREVLELYDVYISAFEPLLLTLYRYYAKAEVLVNQCGEEDWCRAAVFQGYNEVSFESIKFSVSFVARQILECAKRYPLDSTARGLESKLQRVHTLVDLNEISPNYESGRNDFYELRERLEDLARELSNSTSSISGSVILPEQAYVKQHLAQYLLRKKLKEEFHQRTFPENLETILWKKEDEPIGTWGDSKFLGAGSGASGVCQTRWLGVPCAKKVFHGEASESTFRKEAIIMAMSKHPCVVDFICCGNGKEKGDRFIAMELMEKSLFDLIEDRKGLHFSLDVALDIIWQIAEGVEYLHKNGVAHRDLKPQNVVVNTMKSLYHEDYYCVKLVDFGISKSEVEVSTSSTMSFRGIGTTRYRAPEAHPSASASASLKRLAKVNWFKADAYSFAMTCAHVLTLKQPFDDMGTVSSFYKMLIKGHRPILAKVHPKELIDLVEDCWETVRSKRPRFGEICSRLEKIIFNNRKGSIVSPRNGMGMCDTKEHFKCKEQGDTSFYTAQESFVSDEIISGKGDFKYDVSKRCKLELE